MKSSYTKRTKKLFLCLLLTLVLAGFSLSTQSARAQTGVYAAFSAADPNLPNTNWIYGGNVGIYLDTHSVPFLEWGGDLRGSFMKHGDAQLNSGLIGPRFVLHPPVLPIKPYAEVLGGIGHISAGQGAARTSETNFEYRVLAGADVTIFPRIDWRLFEYGYGGFSGLTNVHPQTVSMGFVVRLP